MIFAKYIPSEIFGRFINAGGALKTRPGCRYHAARSSRIAQRVWLLFENNRLHALICRSDSRGQTTATTAHNGNVCISRIRPNYGN